MEIGETLHVLTREEWRAWLERNYDKANDIWLVYANKKSGKHRIPYDEAVEEALCFGWIDSIVKRVDDHHAAQRFSPRRAKSQLSELNRVRLPAGKNCLYRSRPGKQERVYQTAELFCKNDPAEQDVRVEGVNIQTINHENH